jgi:hypothetical protein
MGKNVVMGIFTTGLVVGIRIPGIGEIFFCESCRRPIGHSAAASTTGIFLIPTATPQTGA